MPYTEWLANFDADEYFVPQPPWNDLKQLLNNGISADLNILSFRSSAAKPDVRFMEPYVVSTSGNADIDKKECIGVDNSTSCLKQRGDTMFLETYNCDFCKFPKPDWTDRAKKQIYRPSYVLNHYVHYTTATKGILQQWGDAIPPTSWNKRHSEHARSERYVNELTEAFMLHTKTWPPKQTLGWKERCRIDHIPTSSYDQCRVGIPWPSGMEAIEGKRIGNATTNMIYTCYPHDRLTNHFIPQLKTALTRYQEQLNRLRGISILANASVA